MNRTTPDYFDGKDHWSNLKAFRASLLSFEVNGSPCYEADGILIIGKKQNSEGFNSVYQVIHRGNFQAFSSRLKELKERNNIELEDLSGRLIAPGFIDLHIHYPQTDIIGSPASGLLPWLENYTFPAESQFCNPSHASETAEFFLNEMLRHGVTTALTFATSHPASVDAIFQQAKQKGLRWMAGKVLQDRHSPAGVKDETEQSLLDTDNLIQKWHQVDRLTYAITPRFAPTSSEAQLKGAGYLARQYPSVWIQTHVAENLDEIKWVRELFPSSRSYLETYLDFGLMRKRSVFAHCIHFDQQDRELMKSTGAAAAICPSSNLFLGSGFFDFEKSLAVGFEMGLASDVGGGTSFSPFHTMMTAYYVGREGNTKSGMSLTPSQLWYMHTAGAARALDLDQQLGHLLPGQEADFIVLNPAQKPMLERRISKTQSLEELLFAFIVLADDRVVERVFVAGVK